MRVLFVHPSPLMYSEVYLRLEPLGLEQVAAVAQSAGHEVCLVDLQVCRHKDYYQALDEFRPQAVGFSLNYLGNVPEVVGLAIETKRRYPDCSVFVGGHSASFIPMEILRHAKGAIDCVVRGEGEGIVRELLETLPNGNLAVLPGVVTLTAIGPRPVLIKSLGAYQPAREHAAKRNKYFIGELDPCASIEFSRGCPWDCSFCSGWTFYGRSYRQVPPDVAVEDLVQIREPNVFIVDDVAFIHPEHGLAIGREIERRGIRKQYFVETRCDVLVRNREVFAYWKRLGLKYMFLGLEAIDEETLRLFRKRLTPNENFQALQIARDLGIIASVNVIVDPGWDEERFRLVREWALGVPEMVHLTVNTPYPGTEAWYVEPRPLATLDYRLFDIQHAVLPTKLPLRQFYEELVKTQAVLNRKYLGLAAFRHTFSNTIRLLSHGQTNFALMLWKFGRVYNPSRQYADHSLEVEYSLTPPSGPGAVKPAPTDLYVHAPGAG